EPLEVMFEHVEAAPDGKLRAILTGEGKAAAIVRWPSAAEAVWIFDFCAEALITISPPGFRCCRQGDQRAGCHKAKAQRPSRDHGNSIAVEGGQPPVTLMWRESAGR